jgi:hypothetical protein
MESCMKYIESYMWTSKQMRFLFYYFLVGVNVILVDDNNKRKVSSIFFTVHNRQENLFSPNISNAFSYRIWKEQIWRSGIFLLWKNRQKKYLSVLHQANFISLTTVYGLSLISYTWNRHENYFSNFPYGNLYCLFLEFHFTVVL